MRVLVALVNLELGVHLPAHLGLGEHALDGFFDDLFGLKGEEADKGLFAQAAGEAGVAAVELSLALEAGEPNLFGVDDDNMVADIDIGGVLRAPLTGQVAGGDGGETAQGLAAG